eukprot:gene13328-15671_t
MALSFTCPEEDIERTKCKGQGDCVYPYPGDCKNSTGSTTGGTEPSIDIDLGIISLQLYLAILNTANQQSFIDWARENNKTYSSADYQRRYKIYVDNLVYVQNYVNLNPNSTFQLGMTQFADLTFTEFSQIYGSGLNSSQVYNDFNSSSSSSPSSEELPGQEGAMAVNNAGRTLMSESSSEDYRYKLPPIKRQGTCGSCYIFSALAALERELYFYNSPPVALAEQEVVDCLSPNSCGGGWPDKLLIVHEPNQELFPTLHIFVSLTN